MKADWTKSGGALVTIGDDTDGKTILIGDMGGASVLQEEALFRGTHAGQFNRANIAGRFTVSIIRAHATRAALLTYFAAEYARLNEKGKLELTEGAQKWVMDNSVLMGVARNPGLSLGVRLAIDYQFAITTLTSVAS